MLHLLASHIKLYPTLNKNKQQHKLGTRLGGDNSLIPIHQGHRHSWQEKRHCGRRLMRQTDLQTNLEVLDGTIWISVRKHLKAPRQTNHSFDTISGT